MNMTNLERIHKLAQTKALGRCADCAKIMRKLAQKQSPADKAHSITGVLKTYSDTDQAVLLTALEQVVAKPEVKSDG